jgi:hypothetical protein
MTNSEIATRTAIPPASGTTKLCKKLPHQLYAEVACDAKLATPAPPLCKNEELSAPQIFEMPTWSHMIPSHTRIAVQTSGAERERLSQLQKVGVASFEGFPKYSRTVSMAYQLSYPLAHRQTRRMLGPDVRTIRRTPPFCD